MAGLQGAGFPRRVRDGRWEEKAKADEGERQMWKCESRIPFRRHHHHRKSTTVPRCIYALCLFSPFAHHHRPAQHLAQSCVAKLRTSFQTEIRVCVCVCKGGQLRDAQGRIENIQIEAFDLPSSMQVSRVRTAPFVSYSAVCLTGIFSAMVQVQRAIPQHLHRKGGGKDEDEKFPT